MNKYPEYIEAGSKLYKINTDFRLALRCNEIFLDDSICDYEKMLAIIYILLGEEGLKDFFNHKEMIELLTKYLMCGQDDEDNNAVDKEPSIDFKQDQGYIKASFMSDYKIDLDKEDMSWWKFHDMLAGLKEGCVLSRVRAIREEPLNDKKGKELEKLIEAKKMVELKREKTQKEKDLDKFWENQFKKE